jgi:hypothetical protein
MLLIYLPQTSSRNRYTFKTVFKTLLLLEEYRLSNSLEEYLAYQGPKLAYTNQRLSEGLHFHAVGLLEQRGIKEQHLSIGEHDGVTTLFKLQEKSALPYDAFAAIFFMLSRYEEYLPHMRDKYDRFTAKESLAYQHNFLHKAVVDRWALQIRAVLQREFPELAFKKRQYEYLSTIDIDNAYAFKEKGLLRTAGGLLRSVLKLDITRLLLQLKVLTGKRKDPFDTYNYQLNIQKKYGLKPIYFILLGDYGFNDKNLHHENRHFQSLIKSIADYASVGIHPSFGSNDNSKKLGAEINRLQRIIKREVIRSRQHFLKLSLPETYRKLLEEDILEDYTMGFASELGFRAGTCTPYFFYDLDDELECKLKVFPFQVMESTLKYYLNYSIDRSIVELKRMIDEVKEVDGTFISLWHNESLSDEMEWKGWRKVFEEMIASAVIK